MLPPGDYYIGDLCYVLSDTTRQHVHDAMFNNPNGLKNQQGEFTLPNGVQYAVYFTAYGDGTYHSDMGTEHPVDSGSIGCIPVSAIDKHDYDIDDIGAVVHEIKPFATSSDGRFLVFGGVTIDTNPDHDTDDEDDDDEDDEYEDDDDE